jgi:hypothetical protein
MMTKTTLSGCRRTRPRFAAAAPTPPKFLIGTIEQSENHSTPSKQTTNPDPNRYKIGISAFCAHSSMIALLFPIKGFEPDFLPLAPVHSRKLSGLSRSLDFTPFAQPHPRKITSARGFRAFRVPTLPSGIPSVIDSSNKFPTFCAGSSAQASGVGCAPKERRDVVQFPTLCAASPAQQAEGACALCSKVKNAGRMPAPRKSISNRDTAIRNRRNHTQNQQDAKF